jgi:hypothetical protein
MRAKDIATRGGARVVVLVLDAGAEAAPRVVNLEVA